MSGFRRPNRITIEARSTARDSHGGQVVGWVTFGVYWASIKQLEGRALEAAQATRSDITHEIRMLYVRGITAAHRGRYNGRIFDFATVVDVDEAHTETRIKASEGLRNG